MASNTGCTLPCDFPHYMGNCQGEVKFVMFKGKGGENYADFVFYFHVCEHHYDVFVCEGQEITYVNHIWSCKNDYTKP